MISVRLNTVFLTLSVLIAGSISNVFADGFLFFTCNGNREIQQYFADGMEFAIPREEFEGHGLAKVLKLGVDKENEIIQAFETATNEQKVTDVSYVLKIAVEDNLEEEQRFKASITPLSSLRNGNGYLVTVWEDED